jgi:hypothetical protein
VKRWPVLAAAAYVVAVSTGLFLVPSAPRVTASGSTLVAYYQHHGDGVRAATWLGAVSLAPLALLVAHLRSFTTGIGRDVTMLGAVGLLSATSIWLWFGAGLALNPDNLQPGTARTAANISAYFGPVLTVAVVLLVAPIGLAARRESSGLSRWLAYITAAFVLEQAIETVTIVNTTGFTAPGGAMNLTLGAGLFLVWVLAAGIASTASPLSTSTPVAT